MDEWLNCDGDGENGCNKGVNINPSTIVASLNS